MSLAVERFEASRQRVTRVPAMAWPWGQQTLKRGLPGTLTPTRLFFGRGKAFVGSGAPTPRSFRDFPKVPSRPSFGKTGHALLR